MSHIPGTQFRLFTSPPPGSGALISAVLGISAGYGPDPVDKNNPLMWHRFLEACKYAFAMRSRLGDWSDTSLHNDVRAVVGNLTSQEWWEQTRAKISDTETFDDPVHYGAEFQQIEDGGTSHISIVSPAGEQLDDNAGFIQA
jgi:gamma-glutamyltranspeptidase/glutathione hydrolase/leukotriene-C4 hydrolase